MNPRTNAKQLKVYLKEVRKNLQLMYSQKEVAFIMQKIQQSVDDYFEENPSATFEAFEKHYGKPENIASSMSDDDFKRNVNKFAFKKRCLQIVAVLALFAFVLWGSLCIASYTNTNETNLHKNNTFIEYTSGK